MTRLRTSRRTRLLERGLQERAERDERPRSPPSLSVIHVGARVHWNGGVRMAVVAEAGIDIDCVSRPITSNDETTRPMVSFSMICASVSGVNGSIAGIGEARSRFKFGSVVSMIKGQVTCFKPLTSSPGINTPVASASMAIKVLTRVLRVKSFVKNGTTLKSAISMMMAFNSSKFAKCRHIWCLIRVVGVLRRLRLVKGQDSTLREERDVTDSRPGGNSESLSK